MRELREKSADPQAKPYFLKARGEGIQLSWNHYEKMLPQDAFSCLGLTCYDCLFGPCRINPFGEQNEKTVCGLDREMLAIRTFTRFTGIHVSEPDNAAAKFLAGAPAALKNLYGGQPGKTAACTKKIGFGVLKQENINICVERPSASFLESLLALAKENTAMAGGVSARVFRVSLVGATAFDCQVDIACDLGSGELAVMTGLVDAYITCGDVPSRAKNLQGKYHTVFSAEDADSIKELLSGACKAYTMRDKGRIMPCDALAEAKLSSFAELQETLQKKTYKGICLLGGSSNLKLTQDDALLRTLAFMNKAGMLCVAIGEAALILGKHGLLAGQDGLLGFWNSAALPELLELLSREDLPRGAYFPELWGKEDILALLSCAAVGMPVCTSTRLPFEGAEQFAKDLSARIFYEKPKDAPNKLLSVTRGGRHGN